MAVQPLQVYGNDIMVGEDLLSIRQEEIPVPPKQVTVEDLYALAREISRLNTRMAALESRTFWSMFRDWVRSLWRRP